jgi:hypothetical protein
VVYERNEEQRFKVGRMERQERGTREQWTARRAAKRILLLYSALGDNFSTAGLFTMVLDEQMLFAGTRRGGTGCRSVWWL